MFVVLPPIGVQARIAGKLEQQFDQFVRPLDGQRPQDHRIDDAEDRGVGADAEPERHDDDGRKARILVERPKRVPDIPPQIVQPDHAAFLEVFVSAPAPPPRPHLVIVVDGLWPEQAPGFVRGAAVVHAPAARIAAWGRFRNDGAPARNHGAIMLSKIMQPNAELGMNGQIGLPHR